MTIDEAIKIIRTFLPPVADGLDPDEINAIQLGIEALKRVGLEHERNSVKVKWLLPGETEK